MAIFRLCFPAPNWCPPTQLVSPFTDQPYKNNQIPVDPVAQQIMEKYMPLPNTNQGGFNYAFFTGGTQTTNQFIGRIDHHFERERPACGSFHVRKSNQCYLRGQSVLQG